MRWPWSRRHSEVDDLPKADPEAAERAKREAEVERKKAEAKNAYIDWLVGQGVTHSEENHFSEWVWESMRRKHS